MLRRSVVTLAFTRYVRASVSAVAVFLVMGLAAVGQGTVTRAARGVSWASEADLRAFFKDSATVDRFLAEIENDGDPSASLDKHLYTREVYEYRFVDLDRDGWLELIAHVSGYKVPTFILVVRQIPDGAPIDRLATTYEGFLITSLTALYLENLDTAVRDLDHDGTPEVVVPELLGPYESGPRIQATIPEVYAWKEADFVSVSSRYPEFYRDEVLPRLEREFQKLEALPSAHDAEEINNRRILRQNYARAIAEARKRAGQR